MKNGFSKGESFQNSLVFSRFLSFPQVQLENLQKFTKIFPIDFDVFFWYNHYRGNGKIPFLAEHIPQLSGSNDRKLRMSAIISVRESFVFTVACDMSQTQNAYALIATVLLCRWLYGICKINLKKGIIDMDKTLVREYERLDDLQTKTNLHLIQNPEWFCFGVDAVLLADFASTTVKLHAKVLDLCSGNGIIPLLLTEKSGADFITGLEIQEQVAEMACRSVVLNGLEEKIEMKCGDLKNAEDIFGRESFDNITCNPPYKENNGGLKNASDTVTIARHEIFCTLEDIISQSASCLKPYGKLCLIHRPERLADIICLMRAARLEPKRLRFVHPSPSKTATMILIEGAKYGKPKLFLEPPLYVYNENGEYSDEINRIYGRKTID